MVFKKIKKYLTACFCTFLLVSLCSCESRNSIEVKDEYTFTYDYNYEGGKNRVIKVGANKRASYYDASRVGYLLDGWFEEKECKNEFSFDTPITQDTTVYALWTNLDNVSYCNVTFDYNYDGITNVLKTRKGKTIETRKIAKPDRLGYTLLGWYLDKDLTLKFNFENEIINNDITLYAKYEKKDIKFDSNDEVILENVKIKIGMHDPFGYINDNSFKKVIDKFNEVYEGKIFAEYVPNDGSAANLIFNQTEMINMNYDGYYPMEDVLELININFRESNYNAGHIKNCYIEDKLWTMPVVSFVPCAIYNKRLMKYYN